MSLCPPSGVACLWLAAAEAPTLCDTWSGAFNGGLLLASVGPSVAVVDGRVSRRAHSIADSTLIILRLAESAASEHSAAGSSLSIDIPAGTACMHSVVDSTCSTGFTAVSTVSIHSVADEAVSTHFPADSIISMYCTTGSIHSTACIAVHMRIIGDKAASTHGAAKPQDAPCLNTVGVWRS